MDNKQLLDQIKNIVRAEMQTEAEKTRQKITSEKFDMLNQLVGIEDRLKDVETSNRGIEEKQVDLAVAQKKQEQNINARLDTQSHQLELQGKQLNTFTQTQGQILTAVEALAEGQKSSTAAIRADIQDLASKMAKNKKETDIRLDALEEHTGHHNPIKH